MSYLENKKRSFWSAVCSKTGRIVGFWSLMLTMMLTTSSVSAAEGDVDHATFVANNLWLLIATFMILMMHLGFAMMESGLTRAKNTVNILHKNNFIISMGILSYWIFGFDLMYPGEFNVVSGWLGFPGVGIHMPEGGATIDYANGDYTYWTKFLYGAMVCATAGTIMSGAVAERIKLPSFLLFITLFLAFYYPIMASWTWGGGWLAERGFHDFAGATIVHSTGGWAALVGAALLGPRIGKYVGGELRQIPGHSMPLTMIGVFLLWLGWFGFTGGAVHNAEPELLSRVLMTTCLAAAAGAITAKAAAWIVLKKADLQHALNGIIAGLVSITAGADLMDPLSAAAIGAAGGFIVVCAVFFFEHIAVDDPVGAVSTHLVCGMWGTLAVGIFGRMANPEQLWIQFTGVAAYGLSTVALSLVTLLVIRTVMGLRVSEAQERIGIDVGEHGVDAYSDFALKVDPHK